MWQRILRILSTGFSAYSFYSSPLRVMISIIGVILIPYLVYIFWGSVIIIALAAAGIYFIVKAIRTTLNNNSANYF